MGDELVATELAASGELGDDAGSRQEEILTYTDRTPDNNLADLDRFFLQEGEQVDDGDGIAVAGAKKQRGRPPGTRSLHTDYKKGQCPAVVRKEAAAAWRAALPYDIKKESNNKYRTIYACRSHVTDDGDKCPFTLAQYNMPGTDKVCVRTRRRRARVPGPRRARAPRARCRVRL